MVDSISSAQVVVWSEVDSLSMARAVLDLFLGRGLDLLSWVMYPYPVMQEMLMLPTVSVGKMPAELDSLNLNVSF